MITAEMVKDLRERTGVSVMQCKKALEEAGGDVEKAVLILRKMSKAQSEKKSERTLGAGIVKSYIHSNQKIGVLVELSCETDFVSQNETFQELASDIALHIAGMGPEYVTADQIPEAEQARIKAFFQEEVDKSDKPAEIKEKMLEGKLKDFFAEKTLLDQGFVKNPDMTIRQLIDGAVQKTGEKIEVNRFVRYTVAG